MDLFFSYIIFGIVDNAVMIFGAFTGYEVEKLLPKRFKLGVLMPIAGAGLGNATSDFLGGVSALNMSLAFGTMLGCLIGLVFIPLFNKYYKLSNQTKLHWRGFNSRNKKSSQGNLDCFFCM